MVWKRSDRFYICLANVTHSEQILLSPLHTIYSIVRCIVVKSVSCRFSCTVQSTQEGSESCLYFLFHSSDSLLDG